MRFGARDYDGRIGRWPSKDSILFAVRWMPMIVKLTKTCPYCYKAFPLDFNLLTGKSKSNCNYCGKRSYLSVNRRYFLPYFLSVIVISYFFYSSILLKTSYYLGLFIFMVLIFVIGVASYLFLSTLKKDVKGEGSNEM